MKIKYLVYAALASVFLYVVLFIFIVHKPLTVGVMQGYYANKLSYLGGLDDTKLVLLAGSNGRFSHRCETITSIIGMPCSNMSISAALSLDYQLDIIKPYLNPGDIVYLPLEFGSLGGTREQVMGGAELPYIVAYDHEYLKGMGLERLMHALFYFDFKFFISGLGEMLLHSMHIERRFTLDTLTPQGDESGHTLENGLPYRQFLAEIEWSPPVAGDFNENSYKARILGSFLTWAASHKIRVIGGLPTTFDDEAVPDTLIGNLCSFYRRHGQMFLVLDNNSQYPRSDFYDTQYHLVEERQIDHSRLVADQLRQIINNNPTVAPDHVRPDACNAGPGLHRP